MQNFPVRAIKNALIKLNGKGSKIARHKNFS